MGLLAWFLGPKPTPKPAVPRPAAVKATMLTLLERRRLQRAKRRETVREVMDRFVEAQSRLMEARDLEELTAAARDLSVAAAELRLLHEMPHE